MVILLSLEFSRVLSILGLFTLGPSLYLLGFISNPNTSRYHITTNSSKSLYIYCAQCIQRKHNELINKIECFEQEAHWPLLFLSLSLFSLFSLLSF